MSKKDDILFLLVLPINVGYYYFYKYLAIRNDKLQRRKQLLTHHPIQNNYIKDYPIQNHNP